MAISKTVRFEVFKRDSFRCQYCGKTPPGVMLEVDHIQPRSKGGPDAINNLITACFDCNRGKRDIVLGTIPGTLALNLETLKEKETQLREYNKFIQEYNKFIQKIEARIQSETEAVNAVFKEAFPGWVLNGWVLNEEFKQASVKRFLRHLPISAVLEAMEQSCQRMKDKYRSNDRAGDEAIRYFCGYCWRKIKGDSRG